MVELLLEETDYCHNEISKKGYKFCKNKLKYNELTTIHASMIK